jgi:hypothetical protein
LIFQHKYNNEGLPVTEVEERILNQVPWEKTFDKLLLRALKKMIFSGFLRKYKQIPEAGRECSHV